MNEDEAKEIRSAVNNDGFDYALVHKSDFKEIKDARFHELRDAFIAARKALIEYAGVEGWP